MADRAYVQHNFAQMNLSVYLVREYGERRYALGLPTDVVFQEMEQDAAATYQGPTLQLPESMARALLDALAAHFGGSSDVQTLRKDYLAERARVDKMIDHLTESTHG